MIQHILMQGNVEACFCISMSKNVPKNEKQGGGGLKKKLTLIFGRVKRN